MTMDMYKINDPYDIWTCRLGYWIRRGYYSGRNVYRILVLVYYPLAFYLHFFYPFIFKKRYYSVAFLGFGPVGIDTKLSRLATDAIRIGDIFGWGLPFDNVISSELTYKANESTYVTIGSYLIEPFIVDYFNNPTDKSREILLSYYQTIANHYYKFIDEEHELAYSYSTSQDRLVINVQSYILKDLLILSGLGLVDGISQVLRLKNFLINNQNSNGSWFYDVSEDSFVDCFHSCIILKNLIYANMTLNCPRLKEAISKGYSYLLNNHLDESKFLLRKFSVGGKRGLVRFDLYDSAEFLLVAKMLKDDSTATNLERSIIANFTRGDNYYSFIDYLGLRGGKNLLRWGPVSLKRALNYEEENIIANILSGNI